MPLLLKLVSLVIAAFALLVINRALALARNYVKARKLGLPILVRWSSWQDPLWMMLRSTVKPVMFRLGIWDPKATDYTGFGWPLQDHFATHARLGRVFTIVTPFKNNTIVADVNTARHIYKDWRSWVKEPGLYSMFNVFGPNVNTVNGSDWQRHRKVTAPAFKEGNSKLVWQATLGQMDGLQAKLLETTSQKTRSGVSLARLKSDLGVAAMHVLSYAGMGKEYDFSHGFAKVKPGEPMSFVQAMKTVNDNVTPMLSPLLYAAASLPRIILPQWSRTLADARTVLLTTFEENIAQDREAHMNGSEVKDNLLSTLVWANEVEKGKQVNEGGFSGRRIALSDTELYGNLYIFNLAGHETTTRVTMHALMLIAIHPDVQAWVRAEVDTVLSEEDSESYNDCFPRLVRCQALMHETLRFFSPVNIHGKYTANSPQYLPVGDREYTVPADSFVSINIIAIQFDPTFWGIDAEKFNPSRFIATTTKGAGHESFSGPPNGTEFMSWAFGARACPGKRFSMVEFVAIIATLLKRFEIKAARDLHEDDQTARARLEETMFDADYLFSAHSRRPEDAGVIFVPRKG